MKIIIVVKIRENGNATTEYALLLSFITTVYIGVIIILRKALIEGLFLPLFLALGVEKETLDSLAQVVGSQSMGTILSTTGLVALSITVILAIIVLSE
ncbi:MAG: hypothetical protein PVF83_11540 [Anaerolineales bacterium]